MCVRVIVRISMRVIVGTAVRVIVRISMRVIVGTAVRVFMCVIVRVTAGMRTLFSRCMRMAGVIVKITVRVTVTMRAVFRMNVPAAGSSVAGSKPGPKADSGKSQYENDGNDGIYFLHF